MRTATIAEIKSELQHWSVQELTQVCLRLARFKKDNKELLTYLIYEARNEVGYVQGVIRELQEIFDDMNQTNLYYAKKTLRRMVRLINKYSRYSSAPETELQLRLFFCETLQASGMSFDDYKVIVNLYAQQRKAVEKLYGQMHEDIQYEYQRRVNSLP